jgi:hypothetical protein
MNTKSKIALVAAVLTTLAAPAFAAAVVPEFPGELARPTPATEAQQSYASTRGRWTPVNRTWTQTRSWSDQRLLDRGSEIIN